MRHKGAMYSAVLTLLASLAVVRAGSTCNKQQTTCFAAIRKTMTLECDVGEFSNGSLKIGYRRDESDRRLTQKESDYLEDVDNVYGYFWKEGISTIKLPRVRSLHGHAVYFVVEEFRCEKVSLLARQAAVLANEELVIGEKKTVGFIKSHRYPDGSYSGFQSAMNLSATTRHGFGFEIQVLFLDLPLPDENGRCYLDEDFLEVTTGTTFVEHDSRSKSMRNSSTILCGKHDAYPKPLIINCDHFNMRLVKQSGVIYNGVFLSYRRIKADPKESYCDCNHSLDRSPRTETPPQYQHQKVSWEKEEKNSKVTSNQPSQISIAFFAASLCLCAFTMLFSCVCYVGQTRKRRKFQDSQGSPSAPRDAMSYRSGYSA